MDYTYIRNTSDIVVFFVHGFQCRIFKIGFDDCENCVHRLEGEHVVLGKVIQGMDNVFAIEGGAGTYSGKPRKKVVIADSGEIPKEKWDEER